MKKTMCNQPAARTLLSLLIAMTLITALTPVWPAEARAAELPDATQFADKGDLMQFNTNDADGTVKAAKVHFGQNGSSAAQAWWIAGSQSNGSMVLFAASQLGQRQVFQQSTNAIPYSADWGCSYASAGYSDPAEVSPNNYGASSLRTFLQNTLANDAYFSLAERALMGTTTIYTSDPTNSSIYSATDILYPAYGDSTHDNDTYITVGENTTSELNGGLRVDKGYWGSGGSFWIRAPYPLSQYYALVAFPPYYVIDNDIARELAVTPAFRLDTASVAFASAAPAASSNGALTLENVAGDGAFTLRYGGVDLGSASIASDYSKVDYSDVPSGAYLVAQNGDGAWAQAVSGTGSVSASNMGIDSFENCKVWLETTNSSERKTYAAMAKVQPYLQWEIGSPNAADVIATLHDDGTLVISGNGDVAFSTSDAPWSSQSESIKAVVIENGVAPSSMQDWFYGCTNLVKAPVIPHSVTDLSGTFARCTSLTTAPDMPSSVVNMSSAFAGCSSLETAPAIPSSVKDLSRCFSHCAALTTPPDMANATSVTNMSGTFYGCTSLSSAPAIPGTVTDMGLAFNGCTSLTSAPDMANAHSMTNMGRAFENCTSLKSAPAIPASVTDMVGTFENCTSLETAPDMSQASSIQDMTRTFKGCTMFKTLPMIPSTTRSMQEAFADCSAITSIPIGWKFPNDCSNTEDCFFVPEGGKVTTYCAEADYEYLSKAYNWEASNRTLTAYSAAPDDPDESDDPSGSGDGDQENADDTSNPANDIEPANGKNEQAKNGSMAPTGDNLQYSILILAALSVLSAAVLVSIRNNNARWKRGKHVRR